MGSSAPRSKKETIARLIAIAILVIATVAVLYCSEYFVRRFWDPVVDVKFPNTAFCFSIILILLLGFLDGFDFGGKRMYSLLYAISLALFLTSIITLALPYVVIGRQVSKKVMLVHFLVMLVLSPFWVKLSTAIYFKFCPPLKSLFISDMPSERWVLEKINGYGKKYLIEKTISPKTLDIEQHIQQFSVVIIGNIDMLDKQMILAICASLNKQVLLRPNFTDIMRAGAQAEQFDDLLLLSLSSFDLTSGDRFKKRLFDILFSFTGVVLSLPILLICAILVFLEDRHNPFYLQKRLTKGGRAFNIIKLRTMIPNAEKKDGPVLATEDDPRITKIGRVLRAFRLDEIPQLLNVLIGDMSIVGPRPERPYFYEKFSQELPEFAYRLSIKSGITGFAQVMGNYTTDPHEKLMLDLMYIQHYSFMLDLKLVAETVLVIFKKDASKGVCEDTKQK